MHILATDVGPDLIRLLGWSASPRTAVVAAQLLEIGKLFGQDSIPPHAHDRASLDDSSSAPVAVAMHDLYSLLMSALDGPDADLIQMTLGREGTCTIWAGCQRSGGALLVPTECAVFTSEADFRPWIFTIPLEFHKYHRYRLACSGLSCFGCQEHIPFCLRLLSMLGVSKVMTVSHYSEGLKRLASACSHSVGLDGDRLDMALRLARGAAESKVIYGEGRACVCNELDGAAVINLQLSTHRTVLSASPDPRL